MFTLDGRHSATAIAAQAVIEHSGLNLQAKREDSLAVTAYRIDPLDGYFYLTAFGGLREPEPMFGPLRKQTDYRLVPDGPSISDPYGFRKREAVLWTHSVGNKLWHLYISGRKGTEFDVTQSKQVTALTKNLEDILVSLPSSAPLFPDLWYRERMMRDELRDLVHNCVPGTALDEIASRITFNLGQAFGRLPESSDVLVGIYLDTDEDWRLCGSSSAAPEMPGQVEKNERNAFTWVGLSTRPILVGKSMSATWRRRLEACSGKFMALFNHEDFGGLCLAPLLYGRDHSKAFGLISVVSRRKSFTPAHLFLLSRLSFAVSGYLFSKMPLPGFSWWPEARLRRGEAHVSLRKRDTAGWVSLPESLIHVAKDVAAELMPTNSHVTLSPLRWGHSGAQVFRLDVHDEGHVAEVPRVLKMGSRSLIRKELVAYFRYAHNKALGVGARIDVARSSVWPVTTDQQQWFDGHPPEAIVYTLVGADEEALPWSQWSRNAGTDELKRGLELLWERLQPWYTRTRQAEGPDTIIELMIEPLASGQLQNYLKGMEPKPSLQEVRAELSELRSIHPAAPAKTCIVHGDLHADNVFALLGAKDGKGRKVINRVALIDWGSVRSGWHLLSDISKLMVDLGYRIRPCREMQVFCHETVKEWGLRLGCDPNDWAVALIHQLAKIMFYQANSSGAPYIEDEARLVAWEDLKNLSEVLKRPPSRRHGAST